MARRVLLIAPAILTGLVFVISFGVTAAKAQGGLALDVARLVVCEGISDREPTGVTNTFQADTEKAYVFLEARNIEADTTVEFVWTHAGTELARTPLRIGAGPRWRTFAWKTLWGMRGDWLVEVRGSDGAVLASVEFSVD